MLKCNKLIKRLKSSLINNSYLKQRVRHTLQYAAEFCRRTKKKAHGNFTAMLTKLRAYWPLQDTERHEYMRECVCMRMNECGCNSGALTPIIHIIASKLLTYIYTHTKYYIYVIAGTRRRVTNAHDNS